MITTSSTEDAQAGLDIVHLNVALDPIAKPVTPELAEAGVVMVAVPENTVQVPVPTAGVLPPKVAVVTLHKL